MGTLYGCLHRTLEDKTVGSVNADIGAEACSVICNHNSVTEETLRFSFFLTD